MSLPQYTATYTLTLQPYTANLPFTLSTGTTALSPQPTNNVRAKEAVALFFCVPVLAHATASGLVAIIN